MRRRSGRHHCSCGWLSPGLSRYTKPLVDGGRLHGSRKKEPGIGEQCVPSISIISRVACEREERERSQD